MRKVALITDGWRRLFTYAWPAGILQRIRETGEDVNLYIFNSTGNWSRDAGYNRAEYNIYNLPELSDFDGIILELNNISSPAVLADVISNAKRSGRPVVSIANELGDFYYVGIDNYSAMKQVIAHLHEVHDCKKFWLLVGAQDNYESSCRLQGMLDYAKEHKIKIDKDDIWYGSFDYKSGLEGYKHLWDRHKELPDAVICINDNVAVAVCEAAAQMGFHAPADFRITGFDNFDKAGFYTPSITTVGHIQEEAAYQGMDVLLRLWAGENVPKYNFTETEMLWQESCGCGKGSSRDARAHLKDQIMYSVESEEFDEEVLSMEAEMMQCNTVEEMMYCIPQCIPSLKCDAMYLVLDDHLNAYKKKAVKIILEECNRQPQMHERLMRISGIVSGRQRVILGKNPQEMDVPLEIDKGLYFEAKFDTEALIRMMCEKVLNPIGYDYTRITIQYAMSRSLKNEQRNEAVENLKMNEADTEEQDMGEEKVETFLSGT